MKFEGHPGKEISFGANQPGPLLHRFPLIAHTVGESWWNRGNFVRRHSSNVFVVEMVLSGSLQLISGDKKFIVGPNEAFLLHKKSRHEYKATGSGVTHKLFASIDGPVLEQILLFSGLENVFHVGIEHPSVVIHHFRRLLEIGRKQELSDSVDGSQLSYLIISELARGMSNKRLPEPIRKALGHMGRNLNKPLKIEHLCEIAYVSEATLYRLFEEYCGESPIEYFNRRKLRTAQEFLKRTSLTIKEIAVILGFEDPSYFSRLFRRKYGLTAREFRKNYSSGKLSSGDFFKDFSPISAGTPD